MEKKKLFTYIAAGCFGLGLVLAFSPVLSASILGFSSAGTLGDCEAGWATAFIILINLAGIACLLLPSLGILADKEALLRKCALGAAAGALLVFIIAIIGIKSSFGGDFVHVAFLGWLLIIAQIGAGVCTFLSIKEK